MENNDQTANDVPGEENFAEMLEQSLQKPSRLAPGQAVEAKIVSISSEWVFLDLGGKGEGYLDKKELVDAAGNLTVAQGDRIKAYYLSAGEDGMRFTLKVGSGPAAHAQLEDAWRSGVPVEGTVAMERKGGFEVKIGGSVRAFCPFSQMGLRRGEEASAIGQTLSFRIIEYGEKGRNVVVSRRALLEEEQRKKKLEFRETLKTGMKVKGTVTSIRNFGAFVDIGGFEGLIPASEVSFSRGERIDSLLSVGQEVEVIVKGLDWDKDRVSFSLKDAMPDPWGRVESDFPVGTCLTGTVARLVPFGAFVTLAPGVDGLIHISRLGAGKRIAHPKEVLKEGQKVEVKVEGLDRQNRKLSLSLAEVSRAEEEAAADLKHYQQQSSAEAPAMGTLGDLLKRKMDEKGSPGQ
jgi:small subunit ribosomal protein S1